MPAGFVAIVPAVDGGLNCDGLIAADITDIAPADPEPEFVAINDENETVVTLQENIHLIVLAADGSVLNHVSAGEVALEGVDTNEEGALIFDETITVEREPDLAAWIDNTHFATANEGDSDGGSRGWTIFSQNGDVGCESGVDFEHAVIQVGHDPEERPGNKGIGPEGYVTISERNWLVSANQVDDAGPRAHVMLSEYQNPPAS